MAASQGMMHGDEDKPERSLVRKVGLFAGPIAALVVYGLLPDTYVVSSGEEASLGHEGRSTGAVATWMAIWWMTEAIPLYATALLPLALLPSLGAMEMKQTAAAYAHELIFLFMGGFVLALSMQRWSLDRRISLLALSFVGTRPAAVVGGFMIVTAVLSMWVSNTATSVMMLPIALGVVELLGEEEDGRPGGGQPKASWRGAGSLAPCLLLSIAYAASIGGVGTLIGTPPNLFLASYARSVLGVEIDFVSWMAIGLPLVVIMGTLTWVLLTRVIFHLPRDPIPGGQAHLQSEIVKLGPVGRGEWSTLVVFSLTASSWLLRPWLVKLEMAGHTPLAGLTDPGIAITAALALFVIPIDFRKGTFAMDWTTANRLPWGLLILFGGGLSLSSAIGANGLGEYLGHSVTPLGGLPVWLCLLVVVALMIFLTEITSNTATAATLIPILGGIAPGLGLEPLMLVVPAAIAASCAFMLPVATPPNAVIFGSGWVTIGQMMRVGIWLNLLGIMLITGLCYMLVLRVLTGE
jgi:sodium-dependent dicarboxylate transporter 2/3/5